MADKDKFVNIADLKAKLRYWCKSRGASKTEQESLMETIKRIPYTIRADISETLEIGSGWIPCSERLPETGKEVLVFVKGEVEKFSVTAYQDKDGDWISDYYGDVIDGEVTHWMPLPEPPKEGASDD